MPTYRVTWEIDVEADNPRAAAIEAADMQESPDGSATVYTVREWLDDSMNVLGEPETVDLLDDDGDDE